MSASRRNSMSPSQAAGESTRELKARVISCLNRLSDRDTLAAATNELETIARGLRQESFSTFLACVHTTDSGEKSLVRRQCVRVLGLLAEAHGDDLAPHLMKMIATVIRRLKDSDSSVRSACVDAVILMASRITKPTFSAFLKAFMDVVSVEQDYNSQVGAALCLAAAIEAAPDRDPVHLAKAVPKLLKLVKSECFKAKPALISLLASILGAGGCSNRNVLDSVVSRAIEFLSSEDWAARKSAVEVLERLVVTDGEMAVEYRETCLTTLESRRFDKVKVVRDAMNQTLKLWKEVGIDGDELSPSSESQTSSRDTSSAGFSSLRSSTKSSQNAKNETPHSKKSVLPYRSPPSTNSSQARIEKPSQVKKSDAKSCIIVPPKFNVLTDWKVEVAIAIPRMESAKVVWDDKLEEANSDAVKHVGNGDEVVPRLESKRLLLNGTSNIDETKKHGVSKARACVFPMLHNSSDARTFSDRISSDETCGDTEIEGLSLLQQQLLHIENQQSNLLNLLQRFMGSSQNGMTALESRVKGLEMALDEISQDLAVSNGRMSSSETCCKLPGAEFLSPKFWRRSEGKYSNARMNSPDSIRSAASRQIPIKDEHSEIQNLNHDQIFQTQYFLDFSDRRAQNVNKREQKAVQTPNTRKFNGSSQEYLRHATLGRNMY